MVAKFIGKTILYLIFIALASMFIVGIAYGFWVMFVFWFFDSKDDRFLIICTSLFWACIGGFAWVSSSVLRK